MALSASDLLTPEGALEAAVLWPDLSEAKVNERLEVYLRQGTEQGADLSEATDRDEYTRQWSYYRAYDEVYQRRLMQPSSVEDRDEGSASWLLTQIEWIGQRRDEAKAAADAILTDAGIEEDEEYGTIQSLR